MHKALRVVWWFAPVILILVGVRWSPALRILLGVSALHPAQVHQQMGHGLTVIDVRSSAEYARDSIPGALSLPAPALDAALAGSTLPRDRPVVMVCERGFRSALAATKATAWGFSEVASLEGGMVAWRAQGLPVTTGAPPGPDAAASPRLPTSMFDEIVTTGFALVVKPFYMLLSLVLAAWLWRRHEHEWVLLRRAMLAFFAGELACALNVIFNTQGDVLEILHQAGMIAFGMLLPWAMLELFDRRSLGFTAEDRTCAFQRLCRGCWKRQPVSCGMHRLMLFALPCLILLALVPLSAQVRTMRTQYHVFGTMVPYEITPVDAVAVLRIYPLTAAWLFGVALVALWAGRSGLERAKAPFFLGLGFLTFSMLRFLLLHTFWGRPWWSDAWEELTELATIGVVAWLLWTFRHLRSRADAQPAMAAQAG